MPRSVSHIIIGLIYHPPRGNNKEIIDHIIECVDTVSRQHPYAGILLLGDFNQLLDSALLQYPLTQIVECSTRNSAVRDKIYTIIGSRYQLPCSLPPIGESDHNCVALLANGHTSNQRQILNFYTVRRCLSTNGINMLA
jgi:hypothetical protein